MTDKKDIIQQLTMFGYDKTDITAAMLNVNDTKDINEIMNEIESKKEIKSIGYNDNKMNDEDEETWIALKDVPFRSYFIAFRGTIIAISYKNTKGYWGDGIYIYNVDNDKWDKYISYPDDFESINLVLAFNKYSKEIYGHHLMNRNIKIIDLKKKQFLTKNILQTMDTDPFKYNYFKSVSTAFINNKYHLFTGKNHREHMLLDKNTFRLQRCCKSEKCGNYHGERPWSLMYAQSKRMIIFGGDYDSWLKHIPLFCYEMKGKHVESKWKKIKIELPNEKENENDMIFTRELSYCYHEKSENVLIFDSLGGKHIYIVNINDFKLRESEIKCPENKIYDVILVSHMSENEKIVMGFARKYVGFNQLPLDILNEIANWMEGFDCVHLFDKNRGLSHSVIDVNSII